MIRKCRKERKNLNKTKTSTSNKNKGNRIDNSASVTSAYNTQTGWGERKGKGALKVNTHKYKFKKGKIAGQTNKGNLPGLGDFDLSFKITDDGRIQFSKEFIRGKHKFLITQLRKAVGDDNIGSNDGIYDKKSWNTFRSALSSELIKAMRIRDKMVQAKSKSEKSKQSSDNNVNKL